MEVRFYLEALLEFYVHRKQCPTSRTTAAHTRERLSQLVTPGDGRAQAAEPHLEKLALY